ncbi:MAG: ABC transporter substrate-binding protein [Oscillospiraceae bacterium]|nr:ABC transporter substrate-binding protein [Oscillospiraceae bacterium]
MKKRIISLILCVMIAASLFAGCGSSKTETTAPANEGSSAPAATAAPANNAAAPAAETSAPKHLNVGWHAALKTIDNLTSSSWEPNRLGIAETLTRISPDLELIPWLAESWEHSAEDELTWVFQIRDGVKFSNGKVCDAEAVKAALLRTAETSRSKSMLNIASIDADGLTLTIHTNSVNAALPNNLVDYIAVIWDVEGVAEGASVDADGAIPVGTGPFAITSWDREGKMELAANQYYWGGTPKLDTITVTVIADGNAQAMALENGEVDLNFQLPTENVRQFIGNDAFVINKNSGSRSQMVYFNLKNEFLADLNVRKAITMAINRSALADIINKGDSQAATAMFPASFNFGQVAGIDYDLEGAKKLLADAGFTAGADGILTKNGKPLSFRLITYGAHGSLLPTFAEAMQDALKEIGIAIDISLNEYSAHTDLLKAGDFDLAISSNIMAPALDPQYFADILFRTGADYNYGGYSNADVDALVAELDAEFDPARRVELTKQMQEYIVQDCGWLMLGHLKFQVVGNAKVTGYETQGTELYLLTKDTDIQ